MSEIKTNQAIILNEPGKVSIQDLVFPILKKGEALLKIKYGGICGSDLSSYRGRFAYVSYPRIPGHEFSAEIAEIEENDRNLKPGMTVIANPYFNCDACYSCRQGKVNCCVNNQTMGVQRDGAFVRYITMPMEKIIDGKGLSAETLALVEPLTISYHAVKKARISKGDKVLVVGAGTIGIFAMLAAKHFGAEVCICDISQKKLDIAKKLGADHTIINDTGENFAQTVSQFTGGDGFAVTVEAVGLPSTFQNCIDAVAYSGEVIVIGVGQENVDFDFSILQKKELTIHGSRNAVTVDLIEVIEWIQKENLDLSSMITKMYPFEEGAEAFAEMDENTGEIVKILLNFS